MSINKHKPHIFMLLETMLILRLQTDLLKILTLMPALFKSWGLSAVGKKLWITSGTFMPLK